MKINEYANSSAECTTQLEAIFSQASIAINQFNQHNTYVGLLNLTTALGEFSPLSRKCITTVDELGAAFGSYVAQFTSFSDFWTKISLNAVGNLYTIKTLGREIVGEYLLNRNMTLISNYAGQLVYTVFHLSSQVKTPLTYTETNPLAPNPMKNWVWVPLEATYHFMTHAGLVSETSLDLCESSTANFFLDFLAGIGYEKDGDFRNMVFAFSDALTYTHGMVEGCHDTGVEVGSTWGQINQQVFKQGKFWKNLFGHTFGLISDGMFLSSEIYYNDWINMFGAIGNMFNKVLVKDLAPAPVE